MPVTLEEMNGPDPILKALEEQGITITYLVKKLKQELNAKKVVVHFDKDTGHHYSKPMIDWHIRQKARTDAQRLRGDYPAEKREITGHLLAPDITGEMDLGALKKKIKRSKKRS